MPHGWKARRTISALTAVVAVTAGFGAVGEPLQPEACDTLKAELARLEGLGVGNDLRRGPEVGKRTLAPARLAQVERLLVVIEQIEFRCPKSPPAEAKSGDPAGADGAGPAKAKLKPKPKPATQAAAPAEPAENSAAKPPPKRKATDAFVPPASDAPVTKSAPSQAPSQAVAKSPPAAAPAAKPGLEQ